MTVTVYNIQGLKSNDEFKEAVKILSEVSELFYLTTMDFDVFKNTWQQVSKNIFLKDFFTENTTNYLFSQDLAEKYAWFMFCFRHPQEPYGVHLIPQRAKDTEFPEPIINKKISIEELREKKESLFT